jgi:hypothetical protein
LPETRSTRLQSAIDNLHRNLFPRSPLPKPSNKRAGEATGDATGAADGSTNDDVYDKINAILESVGAGRNSTSASGDNKDNNSDTLYDTVTTFNIQDLHRDLLISDRTIARLQPYQYLNRLSFTMYNKGHLLDVTPLAQSLEYLTINDSYITRPTADDGGPLPVLDPKAVIAASAKYLAGDLEEMATSIATIPTTQPTMIWRLPLLKELSTPRSAQVHAYIHHYMAYYILHIHALHHHIIHFYCISMTCQYR